MIAQFLRFPFALAIFLFLSGIAFGQARHPRPGISTSASPTPLGQAKANPGNPKPSPSPTPAQPMRKASDLIKTQPPVAINASLLEKLSPDNARIVVSIPNQRAYLMNGDLIAIDSPISSGKRGHSSPTGNFSVLEKDKSHHSSIYGDYKDGKGRTVRAGVSARIDSAPSGTHFVGAEMKWFMRLTPDGVGMHVGILPGYPASHGCIRMPSQAAELFYQHVKVGTPVNVQL
ncbi:MAG TPA: L,D-transpeptidase family protein [Chthoniobacterales bacterium]